MATTNNELITTKEWNSLVRMSRRRASIMPPGLDYRDLAQEAALEVILCRRDGKSTVSLRRSISTAARNTLRRQAGYSVETGKTLKRREVRGEDADLIIAYTPDTNDGPSDPKWRKVRLEMAKLVRRTFSLEDRAKLRKLFYEGDQQFTEVPGMKADNARKTSYNFRDALIRAHQDPTYKRRVHLITFRGARVKVPTLAKRYGLRPQAIRDRYHRGIRGDALVAPTGR